MRSDKHKQGSNYLSSFSFHLTSLSPSALRVHLREDGAQPEPPAAAHLARHPRDRPQAPKKGSAEAWGQRFPPSAPDRGRQQPLCSGSSSARAAPAAPTSRLRAEGSAEGRQTAPGAEERAAQSPRPLAAVGPLSVPVWGRAGGVCPRRGGSLSSGCSLPQGTAWQPVPVAPWYQQVLTDLHRQPFSSGFSALRWDWHLPLRVRPMLVLTAECSLRGLRPPGASASSHQGCRQPRLVRDPTERNSGWGRQAVSCLGERVPHAPCLSGRTSPRALPHWGVNRPNR